MRWVEISVLTTQEGLDAVCARFDALGVSQVMILESKQSIQAFLQDALKYWDIADADALAGQGGPCVRAYVADVEENQALLENIKASFEALKTLDTGLDLGSLELILRTKEDEDWANNWKVYYKPFPVGERLLVRPSWEEIENTEGRTVLSLDPGMAFGTGSHHTTRMCLELLEQQVQEGDLMLDIGCGSGILSIAGVLLGAKDAIAVDVDPIAQSIAYENAALNGIGEDVYHVHIGDVLEDEALLGLLKRQKYRVITANIIAAVVIRLCSIVPDLLAPGGVFIASGIIDERVDEMLAALKENGFETVEIRESEDWRAILAVHG